MNKIQHIIFDLGQVLIQVTFAEFLKKFAAEFRIDMSQMTGNRDNGAHIDFMVGKISPQEFHRQLCSHFNHFITIDNLRQLWLNMLGDEISESRLIIDKLHKKKYPLALLSNVDPWHFEYCQNNLPVLNRFSHIFLSYQLKMKKPDLEIYQTVADKLQSQAQHCLFIDDMVENIEAAKEMGFEVIHFVDAEQLEKDLRAKNIL